VIYIIICCRARKLRAVVGSPPLSLRRCLRRWEGRLVIRQGLLGGYGLGHEFSDLIKAMIEAGQ
jgi:hypothetical protein